MNSLGALKTRALWRGYEEERRGEKLERTLPVPDPDGEPLVEDEDITMIDTLTGEEDGSDPNVALTLAMEQASGVLVAHNLIKV